MYQLDYIIVLYCNHIKKGVACPHPLANACVYRFYPHTWDFGTMMVFVSCYFIDVGTVLYIAFCWTMSDRSTKSLLSL